MYSGIKLRTEMHTQTHIRARQWTNTYNTIIIDTEIKFTTTQTTLTYLSVLGHSVLNR